MGGSWIRYVLERNLALACQSPPLTGGSASATGLCRWTKFEIDKSPLIFSKVIP